MIGPSVDLVVPTVGRSSLVELLHALAHCRGPQPGRIFIVCDRVDPAAVSLDGVAERIASRCIVMAGGAAGPAAARNSGWRASRAEWIAFLDDDVVPPREWLDDLAADLDLTTPLVAGSQGRIVVPLPAARPPTDWERNVAGLASARWATADMAYRRGVLAQLGGFDERFSRAYREDSEFGVRVVKAGYKIAEGRRRVIHPVRPAGRWVSVRLQSGNADDALMRALHGRDWRAVAGAPGGRRSRHLVVAGAAVASVLGVATQRRRVAEVGLAAWAAGTAEFAWARIAPGPRTAHEVATMIATSAVLPLAATWHWLAGLARARRAVRRPAQ
jgi:Glycosyl transferase family 2